MGADYKVVDSGRLHDYARDLLQAAGAAPPMVLVKFNGTGVTARSEVVLTV